jgi:hypothetical protein
VSVVDGLEAFEVQHRQRQGSLAASALRQLAPELLVEVAAIAGMGQGVDDGQPVQLLV